MAVSWLVNGGAPNYLLTEMILGVVGLVGLRWVGGVLTWMSFQHSRGPIVTSY